MTTMLQHQAFIVADVAHAAVGQKRKYTGEPYIVHPLAVARKLQELIGDDATDYMVAAALLHDVVEDTHITLDFLRLYFSDGVVNLVDWLTDVSKPEDGNRETRKAIARAHSAAAPAEAQTIKVCDLIMNTLDITSADPNFAVVYMREKKLLLDALTKADPRVRSVAYKIHADWENSVDK